jgi:hypothetical protein
MSLTFVVDETCPKCSKPVKIATIDLHPSRSDLAIHNFECVACGPVRAKIISLRPNGQSKLAAAGSH